MKRQKVRYFDEHGFDDNGIHKETSTKYDVNGFDKNGIHKETATKYNPDGLDIRGYDSDGNYLREGMGLCSDCGKFLHDDENGNEFFGPEKYDGRDDMCEDCFNHYYFKCDCCGNHFHRVDEEATRADDKIYCENCYKDNFTTCDSCNKPMPKTMAINYGNYDICEECDKRPPDDKWWD